MCRRGLLAKPSAALRLAELAGHVASGPGGRASGVGDVGSVLAVPAIVGVSEPRPGHELQSSVSDGAVLVRVHYSS